MMRLKLFNTPVWLPALKGEGMWVILVWPPGDHGVTGFAPTTVRSGLPSQDHPLHQRDLVGRVMPTQPFGRHGWGRRVTW